MWYLIDAKNKILGRLISRIACILIGKNKSNYLPYINNSDYIILINVSKILVTGNKFKNKRYYFHSGYVGSIKYISFSEMLSKSPEFIIRHAIKGMLPKNIISNKKLKRLKIYSGNYYKQYAQKPVLINIFKK